MEKLPGWAGVVLGYVLAAYGVDVLAAHNILFIIPWWRVHVTVAGGFDVFRFGAWLLMPLAFTLAVTRGRVDLGYFGWARWRRVDVALLGALAGAGVVAMLAIPLFASLRGYYGGMGEMPAWMKWREAWTFLLWTGSWLIGWEFLHRFVLLTALHGRWPRAALAVVPLLEGLYHWGVGKPDLETTGMIALSVVLCGWTVRRQNVLLPFLAHLLIELELLVFLLLS